MRERKPRLREALLTEPYIYLYLLWFFGYLALNIWVNETYIFWPTVFELNPRIAWPYVLLTGVVTLLVPLSLNLIVLKYRELRAMSGATGWSAVGAFAGLLGGACPGCLAGLFPAVAGLFGSAMTLNDLPFYGTEVLLLSAAALGIGVWYLSRPTVCEIPPRR